jgi:YCII-related domain
MEDELNERERDALAAVPRDIDPRPELRDRIEAELHRNGLLRRGRGATILAVAAALIAGFIGGLLLPRTGPAAPPRATPLVAHQREFILFVHDTPYMRVDGKEAERVDEYRRWAQELRARGTLTGGEKLRDERSGVGSNSQPSDIGGFFRIVARNRAEAEAVARSCPHIRHGGWIEVREIDHG